MKKGSSIDNIYKQIIKINIYKQIIKINIYKQIIKVNIYKQIIKINIYKQIIKININKQIIKINDFNETSKDYLLVRLATFSNKQKIKIKIKLFNNSTSYSLNEEVIDLQTVNSMQYSPRWSSSAPIADALVCNIIDHSIQDIVTIVDTHACNNNNINIQDVLSPLLDTVSPQQTPVTLKLLNKSYFDLYSQIIAIKEFLLNEICILRKKVYAKVLW